MEKTAEKVMETPKAIEKEVATEEQLRKAMEDIQKRSSEALNSQLAKKAETEEQIAEKKEEVQGFFSKLKAKFNTITEKKPLTEEGALAKMNVKIRDTYEKMKQSDPDRAQKFLEGVQKNHDTNLRWNGTDYVSGRYGSSSGDLGGNYGG